MNRFLNDCLRVLLTEDMCGSIFSNTVLWNFSVALIFFISSQA